MRSRILTLLAGTAAASVLAGAAFAEDQTAPTPAPAAAPAAPAAPASWLSTVSVTGHIEAGFTANPSVPDQQISFGRLFDDRANTPLLNQVAITVQRPLNTSGGFDVGFKLQGMYGSDSRVTHFIGELDRSVSGINQFDVVEANVQMHLPILTKGGMDIKAGQFSTPIGQEVIDPTGNFFYSHSYIFNFGIPLKHTGILTTTHVSSVLDIYAGYDTGVNTSVGTTGGPNANQFHFLGGFGLNLKGWTVLALTHVGPEDCACGPNAHSQLRYLNDVLVTHKINDKLTSVTEFNYIRDDNFGAPASGGGVAEYLTYTLTPQITAAMRAEVWRDNNGFFVAAFPGNFDFVNLEVGRPGTYYGQGPMTYGAVTFGLNIKPAKLPKQIDGLTLRPEIRYDTALSSGHPFNGSPGSGKDQVTIGIDLVVPLAM